MQGPSKNHCIFEAFWCKGPYISCRRFYNLLLTLLSDDDHDYQFILVMFGKQEHLNFSSLPHQGTFQLLVGKSWILDG